jgi:hypothetical protein
MDMLEHNNPGIEGSIPTKPAIASAVNNSLCEARPEILIYTTMQSTLAGTIAPSQRVNSSRERHNAI